MVCRIVAVLVAGVGVVSAGVTTSTASTAYAIPSIINNYGETVATALDVGTAVNTNFKVYETLDFGDLNDWSNGYSVYRGAGGLCSLSGRNFWFFGQTTVVNKATGNTVASVDTSGTISTTFEHAWTLDFTSNLTTGIFNPIPYTLAEQDANTDASSKVVLSSHSNCVQISATEAVGFWKREHYIDLISKETDGNTLAYYTLDTNSNKLSVVRDSELFFDTKGYQYGSFANVVVNGVAYLYAIDVNNGYWDLHVASVPVSTIRDITTYTYYDASSGEWSTSRPLCSGRRENAAVATYWLGFRSGSIFYSAYHNAFLLIFFANFQDNKFRLMYSSTPMGPWSEPVEIYWSSSGSLLNDHGIATQIYYDNTYTAQPCGKEILLTYSYFYFEQEFAKAIKLKFA
ncbi:hypothetical protein V1511DRAFT_118274 [Dipodascopsis uninucleata]